MGSPKHNEEVNHTRKECFLDWWEVWRITGPTNIWRSQMMKSSETTDCSDFFRGPTPQCHVSPTKQWPFWWDWQKPQIFWWNIFNPYELVMNWGYWHIHLPPPSSKKIQTKQYSSRSLSKATCSPTGLRKEKGLGFKELNSQNWSQHIIWEIQNDNFVMFYG